MRITASSVLLGVMACGTPSEPSTPEQATYRITPQGVWAGNTVTIESQGFRDLGDGAELRLGLTTVPLVAVDDTTMTAMIPSSAGGVYDPVVVMGDSLAVLDQIEVWGFAATRSHGPGGTWLPWDTYAWPKGGVPQVIAGTTSNALAIINLEAEEYRTIPNVYYQLGLRGPGPTPEDSVFLLKPQGQPLQSWKFTTIPEKLGEHPEITGNRQVMRLGLHTWLQTTTTTIAILRRADSNATYQSTIYPANDPQGVYLSPRKDRATLKAPQPAGGSDVPVFAAPSGELAYYAPLKTSQGVDWSADGALLAMGGKEHGGAASSTIVIMNATSGAVLATTTTELEVFAVAFDTRRPYLYVGVTSATGHLAVEVYRRTDLSYLGRMEVPVSDQPCGALANCEGGVLAVGINEVHAFYGWNGSARSSRFFLPSP